MVGFTRHRINSKEHSFLKLKRIMLGKYISVKKHSLFLYLMTVVICTFLNIDASAGVQATFYVSPFGNDSNSGTLAKPFATIHKARDTVRTFNWNMTGDIIIYLRGGLYELASTLTLTNKDSGSNGYKIIYQAYNCETPVISGGMKISGWILHDTVKNIYRAIIDKSIDTRQLYVNGSRAIRSRSINALGWWDINDGYDCPAEISTWNNLKNVEVVSYNFWKCHRGPIDSMRSSHAVMAQPYWDNLHIQNNAPAVWIENAYELLDAEGEWYLDRSTGTIYYKPMAGEDMANAEVIIPTLETLVSGSGVSNVQFKGITFAHSTWTLPNSTSGFACLQADAMLSGPDWQFTQVFGNVVFDHSNNIRFENNTFKHLGITALQFYTGCKKNIIYNNLFDDISGSAISIGGLINPTPSDIDLVKDNIIDNNSIRNAALEYKGCVGILVGYTEHTTITHNEIRYLPYTGISVGWGWGNSITAGKNNEISYNLIDSTMMTMRDGAGIYTLSSQPGTNVHDNYINHQFNEPGALYPDEGSSNMHWHHNVLRNIQSWLHMWATSIQNDTIDFNYYDNPIQTTNGSNCVIQNNVLVSDDSWPVEALKIIKNARRVAIINKLTGISVTSKSTVLHVDDSLQLAVNITSCDSGNKSMSWVSSDPFIATVNANGLVKAMDFGNAIISVTTKDGSITDSLNVTVIGLTGTSVNVSESDFIYPNPATDMLHIQNLHSSNALIMISDMQGKLVAYKQLSSSELDISNLSKGIYTIKCIDSGNVLTSKFVKE
jgi:uncharacterized protein YjdB